MNRLRVFQDIVLVASRRRFAVAVPVLIAPAAVAASWAVIFAVVPPSRQEFPLIDDWSFARGAFRFARGGGFAYDGWAGVPLLGQWVWASSFVWAFGESHVALRLLTIVLMRLGLIALFDLLRSEPGILRGRRRSRRRRWPSTRSFSS